MLTSYANLFADEPDPEDKSVIYWIETDEPQKQIKKNTQYWNLLWNPKVEISPNESIFNKPKNNITFNDDYTKC